MQLLNRAYIKFYFLVLLLYIFFNKGAEKKAKELIKKAKEIPEKIAELENKEKQLEIEIREIRNLYHA